MSTSVIVAYALVGIAVWSITRAVHAVLISRRSGAWKLAVAVVGLGLGTVPALDGRPLGYAAVAAGALAATSLLTDIAERRGWSIFRPRLRSRRSATESAVTPGALTELDQAAFHLTALRAAHARLLRASAADDLLGQLAAAAAISGAAGQLRDAVAVVVEERRLLDRST